MVAACPRSTGSVLTAMLLLAAPDVASARSEPRDTARVLRGAYTREQLPGTLQQSLPTIVDPNQLTYYAFWPTPYLNVPVSNATVQSVNLIVAVPPWPVGLANNRSLLQGVGPGTSFGCVGVPGTFAQTYDSLPVYGPTNIGAGKCSLTFNFGQPALSPSTDGNVHWFESSIWTVQPPNNFWNYFNQTCGASSTLIGPDLCSNGQAYMWWDGSGEYFTAVGGCADPITSQCDVGQVCCRNGTVPTSYASCGNNCYDCTGYC